MDSLFTWGLEGEVTFQDGAFLVLVSSSFLASASRSAFRSLTATLRLVEHPASR